MAIFPLALLFVLGEAPAVDFDTDIVPRLTKAGCNAAACHGAAAGRGGFRLSLFGGDPASDYHSIVRQLEGRRVNLRTPSQSLLLLKPTGQLDHAGGLRFDSDGATAKRIESWIRAGTPRGRRRRLKSLAIAPVEKTFGSLPATLQIRVRATFADGGQDRAQDVTKLAVYTALDTAAVKVSSSGQVKLLRPGQHHVMVQFLDRVDVVTLWSPLGKAKNAPAVSTNWIDKAINGTLRRLRLPIAPRAQPTTSLRRVTLDLTGRLPKPKSVAKFINNKDPNRYSLYIDSLLRSDAFNDYWTLRFAKLLRIQSQPRDRQGARTFHRWVKKQLRDRRGLDEMATALLTASGDSHQVGPANFYRVSRGARKQAEFVSEALMGVRLRCANCHNHPLDRWTQDDYHGLAAIFSRIQQGRIVSVLSSGSVIHPRTGENAQPRIPGNRFLAKTDDARAALARWMTDPKNPYFAKAQTNRIWKALMGRGLYEPTDDLRATNPPTHPKLLNGLSQYFAKQGFNIRKLIRLIVMSESYRRRERGPRNPKDAKYYSYSLRRPLPAEVLADAISDVTGIPQQYGSEPLGTRAVQLFDSKIPSLSLDILGRCSRSGSCEGEGTSGVGLAQRLHLINGPLLNRRIIHPTGRLQKLIAAGGSTAAIVDEFYRRALSRRPTSSERDFWTKELGTTNRQERRKRLEDFAWSLLTSRGFRTNH